MRKLTASQQDKMVEAAQNAIEYQVTGRSRFPYDMLRYDLCWPASEADARIIWVNDQRTITLKGLKYPTQRRWESFGWTVVTES